MGRPSAQSSVGAHYIIDSFPPGTFSENIAHMFLGEYMFIVQPTFAQVSQLPSMWLTAGTKLMMLLEIFLAPRDTIVLIQRLGNKLNCRRTSSLP